RTFSELITLAYVEVAAPSPRTSNSGKRPGRASFLFGQSFRTLADLLQHCFKLLHFLRRHILKYASDQSGMPAKNGLKNLLPFFRQRHRPNSSVRTALLAADQALFIQPVHGYADRAGIEIHLWANEIHGHWSFMQQYIKDAKI